MSMLSAQCDELRWLADNLEEHDSHMDEYVQAMRSAAVTIWELRNKMCDMVDERERARVFESENAKLRAERDEWHRVAVSKQDIIDHMRDARAENAKLRELAQDFDKCLDTALCLAHGAGYPVMPDQKLFDSLRPRMRELGIEVTP